MVLFSEANRAYRDGRYEEAIAIYQVAAERTPGLYLYHENLGQALERAGRLEEAIAAYRQALKLRRKSVAATYALKRLNAVGGVDTPLISIQDPIARAEQKKPNIQTWDDPEPVRLLRSVKPRDEDALVAEYFDKGLDLVPDTFVLYRIVGNDLYPRHAIGQSRKNVEFILNHERQFPNCSKRWIVNRIVNQEERDAIIALLEGYGQTYIEIPFVMEEFLAADWDFSRLPSKG